MRVSRLQRALALAMLLGLCAARLHAQEATTGEKSPTQPLPGVHRPSLSPAQQPVLVVNPQQLPNNQPAKAPSSTQVVFFQEITSTFVYAMFFIGGVVVLAMAARFYFYITAPTDLVSLVETDPWVRAELAKPDDAPKDAPAPAAE